MKPFDLTKALAGDPVITRDGREVTEIYHFKTADPYSYTVFAAVVGSGIGSYTTSGQLEIGRESNRDLFMASVKKQEWLNVYPPIAAGQQYRGYGPYPSKIVAKNNQYIDCIATVLIREWEE